MCKMFSLILHKRLSKWSEVNNIVTECQNGFRKGTHKINTIITIVEIRKSQHKSTFADFIELRKVYGIYVKGIWGKWKRVSINKSFYDNV